MALSGISAPLTLSFTPNLLQTWAHLSPWRCPHPGHHPHPCLHPCHRPHPCLFCPHPCPFHPWLYPRPCLRLQLCLSPHLHLPPHLPPHLHLCLHAHPRQILTMQMIYARKNFTHS